MDGGNTWFNPDPQDGGFNPDHEYHYIVHGEGQVAGFILGDSFFDDNYGLLIIEVAEAPQAQTGVLEQVLFMLKKLEEFELTGSFGDLAPPPGEGTPTERDIKGKILDFTYQLLDGIGQQVPDEFPFRLELNDIRRKVEILVELERIEAKIKFLSLYEAERLVRSLERLPEGDQAWRSADRVREGIKQLIEIERLDGPPYPDFLDWDVEILGASGVVSVDLLPTVSATPRRWSWGAMP